MAESQSEQITHLLERLSDREIDDVVFRPSHRDLQEVPAALLSIANQSPAARRLVINALVGLIEEIADDGRGTIFYIACDLLGNLKAVEAIDTLVKYLDYRPSRFRATLRSMPSVKGLIQIGEPAIPKIAEALMSGKSLLHKNNHILQYNAVSALIYIGGIQSLEVLKRALAAEQDESERASLQYAINEIELRQAEKQSYVTRVRAVEFD